MTMIPVPGKRRPIKRRKEAGFRPPPRPPKGVWGSFERGDPPPREKTWLSCADGEWHIPQKRGKTAPQRGRKKEGEAA